MELKTSEEGIEPARKYNTDGEGFMLGLIRVSRRVLSMNGEETRGLGRQVLEDGSREWLTLTAGVGASDKALPSALVYAGDVR